MTFEAWMKAVDAIFVLRTGLGRDDWADNNYWDMWESDMTPLEAVTDTIENEYGDEGLEAFGLGE